MNPRKRVHPVPRGRRRRQGPVGLVLLAFALALAVAGTPSAAANHGTSTLEVTSEFERNRVGDETTLTATISPPASTGEGAGNVLVRFEIVRGPHALQPDDAQPADFSSPDFSCPVFPGETKCTTPPAYTGQRAAPPTDTIVAWIDHDGGNAELEADPDENADAGAPPAEPGCEGPSGCGSDYGEPGAPEPDVTDVVLREWGQLRAAQRPAGAGLQSGERTCLREQDTRRGSVAATAQMCSYAFVFPVDQEFDEANDYGAAWVQGTLDPRGPWCGERVVMNVDLPEGASLLASSPDPTRVASQGVEVAALSVGNPEFTDGVRTLRASYFAYPRRISVTHPGDGSEVRLVWKGSSRARLAFAMGLAISWDASGEPPGLPAASTLGHSLDRGGAC